MRINFDRICRLAGVESKNERRARLTEGASHQYKMEMEDLESDQNDMHEYDEMHYEEDEKDASDPDNEMVEVDPAELMEEIRRAKKIMVLKENRKRQERIKKKQLQENHLKRVIKKEIQNIMRDIDDSDNSWVYGNRKPRHSRKGYTNQGRTLPGIGFNKKW